MSLTFNQSADHAVVTPDAVNALIERGTTEKRAVALVLRDAGYTNQAGGDAFGELFGTPVKSGGFGNLVTGALRDVGRGEEISSTGGGNGATKVAREVDPVQMLRDELDRERAALDAVATPVADAEKALAASDEDLVDAEVDRLEKVIAETKATLVALTKDSTGFVASTREKLTARRDAVKTAAGEREKVHAANVTRLTTVIEALDAVKTS